MRRIAMRVRLAACLGVVAVVGAAFAAESKQLFRKEADLFVERTGLVRLVLPIEVMAECKPDLADLRIFDRSGREVPYLVDANAAPEREAEPLRSLPAQIVDTSRKRSPETAGTPFVREEFRVAIPDELLASDPAERASTAWVIEIASAQPRFVRTARVWLEPATERTPRLLARSMALFRLAGGERTAVELAGPPVDGELRIEIEGHEEFYLEPSFRIATRRAAAPTVEAVVPLQVLSERAEPGRTILEVARPGGVVPDALRIATKTGSFLRHVSVTDQRLGRDEKSLGAGDVFRVFGLAAAEQRDVALREASGDVLRIEIEDLDSPALGKLEIFAVLRQPALVFEIEPASGGEPAGVVRFAGRSQRQPVYDLAQLAARHGGDDAMDRAVAALRRADATGEGARLGPVRDAPAVEPGLVLALASQPGAPLDSAPWLQRRTFVVPAASQGLARVRLAPEDLAAARPDLGDLRVVSERGEQRPYLLEHGTSREMIDGVARARRQGNASQFAIDLPVAPLPVDLLHLDLGSSYFDRAYELFARGEDGERLIATGRLMRSEGESRRLAIPLRGERVQGFELRVDDGDDAPLAIEEIRARIPLADLFVLAAPGSYQLLVGNPAAEAPRYDVARVANLVLAEASLRVDAHALEPNPEYRATSRLLAEERRQALAARALVWGALLAAVALLIAITVRAVRQEPAAGDGDTHEPRD